MEILSTHVSNTLGKQSVALVSGLSTGQEELVSLSSPFRTPGTSISAGSALRSVGDSSVQGRGSHFYALEDSYAPVGDTDVMVKVSDFHTGAGLETQQVNGEEYDFPSYTKMGSLTIMGSDHDDQISISQDTQGNTLLAIFSGGKSASVNLGKIAKLNVYSNGGDDTISVDVDDFYGGISVEGGSGDDSISVSADRAMQAGVTIDAGAGSDSISLSGEALRVLAYGGEGDDLIDAEGLKGLPDMTRTIYGGGGNDLVYGSAGIDSLYGGAGHDVVSGLQGSDFLYGGTGDDHIYGGLGADYLFGEEGGDSLYGRDGADILFGGAGNDTLMGHGGGDTIFGGSGDDRMYGSNGSRSDLVYGPRGNVDIIRNYNYLRGGEGSDLFAPSSTSPTYVVPYSGMYNYLVDYNSQVDSLV